MEPIIPNNLKPDMPEPSPVTGQRRRFVAAAAAAVLVLAAVLAWWAFSRRDGNDDAQNNSVGATPTSFTEETSSPTASVSPSTSATPDGSPGPTASPTPQSDPLDESAKTVLNRFYAAYAAKDRAGLRGLFSSDGNDELRSLSSRLFTGLDIDGTPGGPTLFSSNSASDFVKGYEVTSSAKASTGWTISIKEDRISGSGQAAAGNTTVIKLVSSGSSWLVDSYSHAGTDGKYNGFLLQ